MGKYKFLIALVILVLVGVGGWYALSSHSGDDLASIADSADAKPSDAQVKQLISKISNFMVVPDESPSVVVIRDVATLAAQQSFYKDAQNGDFLIVYSNRAIIYDAKTNKLVNVGPIMRNDATPSPVASGSAEVSPSASVSPSATPATPEKVVVDVRNGTGTAGLAGATASELKQNKWVTIGVLGDAKGSYAKTVIVDLSKGQKPNAVAEIAKQLSASVVTVLPSGEKSSTADILVIVGK